MSVFGRFFVILWRISQNRINMKKIFTAIIVTVLLPIPAVARGYVKRPACVPTWVKTVKANDLTDQQGKKVKQGNYRVMVEATLYQASDIIYSGIFSTQDKTGNVTLTSKITEPKESHKDMITDVKAVLK